MFFMIWHGDVSRWLTFSLGQSLSNHYIVTLSHIGTWQWMQHEYFYFSLSYILYVGSGLFAFISSSWKRIQIQYTISNKSRWFTGHEMLIIFIALVTELIFLLHCCFPLKFVSSFHSTTSIQTWQETDRTEEKTQQRNKPMTPHIYCMTVNVT